MPQVVENYSDRTVCIVGLGYVGLTLAVVMADCGFRVIGVEIREEVVQMLREGRAHFHEPGINLRLNRMVQANRIELTTHIPEDCPASVYVITVGTPLNGDGRCRLDMIERVSSEIADRMTDGALVILRSTVKLGTTRDVVGAALARSGKRFDLAFCPERTVEGRALAELRSLPQIVSGSTPQACVRAAAVFSYLTPTVVQVTDLETAEMIKLISNSYRDVSFSFANEVARLCDASGISALEVINAGKFSYPRTDLPLPGPVGGPCLEKDPHILAESVSRFGVVPELISTGRRINERQPGEVAQSLKAFTATLPGFPDAPVIALMGLAFKGRPETDDIRGSMAFHILAALREVFPNARFRSFDKVVSQSEQARAFATEPFPDIDSVLEGADLAIIANNHPCFESMPIAELSAIMARPAVIYDFWNHYNRRDIILPDGVFYGALGDGLLAGVNGARGNAAGDVPHGLLTPV